MLGFIMATSRPGSILELIKIKNHATNVEKNNKRYTLPPLSGEETTTGVMFDSTGGDKWLDDGRLVPQEVTTRKKLLSDDEQQYAARLVAKHGCDFRSMMLDHEDSNPNQLSQGKCKSLVKKILALGKHLYMPVDLPVPE